MTRTWPYSFWGEAVNTAIYIFNRCPTKALENKTPVEAFSGRKPGIKHLKIFGCICYCHIPGQLSQKLDEASIEGVLVGYGKAEKATEFTTWLPKRYFCPEM